MTGRRTRRRAPWVVLAVATALVVLVPTGLPAWARLNQRTETSDSAFTRPVTAVRLDSANTEFRLSPGPAGQVAVHQRLTWSGSRPQVRFGWEGTTLTVTVGCHWRRALAQRCDTRIDLRVPAAVAVTATSTGGAIQVHDLTGDLHLRGGSGVVDLRGTSGRLWAQVDSGVIVADRLAAPDVRATSSTGVVTLGFTRPPARVVARTTTGLVRVTVPVGSRYRVTGSSGPGPRSIDTTLVDAGATGQIQVDSTTGPVSVGYPGGGAAG